MALTDAHEDLMKEQSGFD
jgi:hypothetical protein